ncbi:hypothetical protein IscW_ISCW000750 [Ixodes scapularis]|uniref:Uncharacterized protein n=1 Tax=Ixodes scapularis TaxID=6945 RepID=B7P545_IXOSC|nr:hypothetical protein IscW_ISCW000750 [Ixodes scapularis]|eukprot:XP_002406995.1 hypothetical protein IscW_ISCW000750 [Ixodes scapularis]
MGVSMAMSVRSLLRKSVSKRRIMWKIVKRSAILFFLGIVLTLLITTGSGWTTKVRDILLYWPEWLVMLALLAVHLALTFFFNVPDCGGPGGLHLNGSHFNCTGGAAGYIDRTLLGGSHIYQAATPRGIIGGVLCKFSKEDGWIPLNKNLWSVSYILAMASTAFLLLALFYYIIDVQGFWSGMNSIAVYVGHDMVNGMFPWAWKCYETHWCYLFMNLWGTSLWMLAAFIMYRKGVFIAI